MLMVSPPDFWGFDETTHGECSARCNGKSVKFPPLPILVLSPWWSHEQLRAQLKNLNLRERVDWVCSWDHPAPGWGKVLSAACSLVTQLCPTLCDPMSCSPPDFLSPSLSPGLFSNSCPLNPRCHPTTSSSGVPFSSCLQSFPASGSFPMSQFFASGGPSIGASATRGHQLHGKERVEFQRLSPLPWDECHLIYSLGTKFGRGWCWEVPAISAATGGDSFMSFEEFSWIPPVSSYCGHSKKKKKNLHFYFQSFFFYIYATKIDNILSVWKKRVDKRRVLTLKCFRFFEPTRFMSDHSIWRHIFS